MLRTLMKRKVARIIPVAINHMENAYGLWPLVVVNSAVLIIFAFSFTKPKTSRDWRSFSAFSAFVVALFAEMYGFPLTIYLASGWLSKWMPGVNLLAHNSGHLFEDLLGWGGDPHMGPFHLLSYILIGSGFVLIAKAWGVLYKAQRDHTLAASGPYARIRHPQYLGFILIMLGFLFQWPTLITFLMFPVLVWMYIHLAKREERGARAIFGEQWDIYAERTPRFIPRLKKQQSVTAPI